MGFLALFAAGCAGRSAQIPRIAAPTTWNAAQDDPAVRTDRALLAEWWKTFEDPLLDSLVSRAVQGNLDLRMAVERLREARAASRGTTASELLPGGNISGTYSDRSGAAGTSSRNSGSGLYQVGFDAGYELSFFGGTASTIGAAKADALAAEEGFNNALVSVAAEMARNYVGLRQTQQSLELSRKTLAAQEEMLRLTEVRRKAGLVSDLDVTRATAQVQSIRSDIPALEARAAQAMNAIAVLAGVQPGPLQAELSAQGSIPASPAAVPVGLPSDLLRRRPDIRMSEREIQGAAARVGVAVSNLYPKFSLTGQTGGASGTLLSILSGAARLWSFGSGMSWGLLNYPATKANIEAAKAREQQSVTAYEKSILTALQEVEDSLAAYSKEKERLASLIEAAEANRRAVDLANLRYTRGLSSFLDVLDAQRSLYSAEAALNQSQGAIATDLVALYKALGGGWPGANS
jgi:outer membrane protein, multidrug efflux system